MIPTVSIVGRHDSGKTRLIARLIPILAARGLRVGAVKHAPQLETLDAPGSDSAAHFAAGARRVLLHTSAGSALFWPHDPEPLAGEIDRLFADCDLVLVEGGKGEPFPKIEVFRRNPDLAEGPLAGEIDVLAVVTDDRVVLPDGVGLFATRDLETIADLIEDAAFGVDPDA